MGGITEILRHDLQQLRVDEMNISKKFRKLLIWTMGFSYISPIVSPILTFAVFSILAQKSDGTTTLDTAKVFTSLSLFTLLSEPLSSLIMALATFMGGVGSFQRIQEFLSKKPLAERRKFPHLRQSIDSTSEVGYDTDNESQKSQRSQYGSSKTPKGSTLSFSGSQTVVIEGGNFGWDAEKQPSNLLSDIDMIVPRAKITMIVGPVGCGKSTLLKAILGELPVMDGTVLLSTLRIALCDQTPWHVNGTVQQSIVGISDFDQKWYAAVIRSCALDEDLRLLPQGDQTQIGSKGIALSGGQSQRVVRLPVYDIPRFHLPLLHSYAPYSAVLFNLLVPC